MRSAARKFFDFDKKATLKAALPPLSY